MGCNSSHHVQEGGQKRACRAAKETRKALSLLDGIAGGSGIEAIVSFPGLFQEEWNEIVATADLLKRLDPEKAFFSTACIFLPDGDANFGKHCDNDVDKDGKCFCSKLYGERKAWGCKWFDIWRHQMSEVLRRGQKPVVVYKAGQVGEGDDANWDDFPIPFTTSRRGLGGSQAGEVALMKMHVGEHFIKRDVQDVSRAITGRAFVEMRKIIRGAEGGQKLADAIESSFAAQQGLRSLTLLKADIGVVGAKALARALPKLTCLQELDLVDNSLGDAGCSALAEALPQLPALKRLYLDGNDIGGDGARALAKALPELKALKRLSCGKNKFGDAGTAALAKGLAEMPALEHLRLNDNSIGEAGIRALAEALPNMQALTNVGLVANKLGETEKGILQNAKTKKELNIFM